ncbi:ArsR family transcriptional regulator [Candidatus Woesearchaeota archaeon]|nr:ArsR family transcriptional regulator [Candidatus Woesearchaeota archaeon]
MYHKIHWWNFPEDIRILIDDKGYRKSIFRETSAKIAKKLGVSRTWLVHWRIGKKGKSCYIPVSKLKKLHEIYKIPKSKTENFITSYRTSCGKCIDNPILPILESPELFQIIGHLYGDGSVTKDKYSSSYCNTSNETRANIRHMIHLVFGKAELKEYHKSHIIKIPSAISKIVMYHYKIDTFYTFSSKIPEQIIKKEPSLVKGIIKAFIIDEGSIKDSNIDIYSANLNLMKDLQNICLKLNYNHSPIKRGSGCFYFKIYAESIKKIAKDLIPLPHTKKNEQLLFIIKKQKRSWNHKNVGRTKKDILELLSKKSMTAYELGLKLLISSKTIREHHLKKLEKEGKVIKNGTQRKLIWSLSKF